MELPGSTVKNIYGPFTIECGPFGRFTKFLLWFRPMHVYQTPEAVTVYKMLFDDMYVLLIIRGTVRGQTQSDDARFS